MDACDSPSDAFVVVDPEHIDCVLAAGDAGDLAELRAWCAGLAPESYGQVFIEHSTPAEVEPLVVPAGVGVTWIRRAREQSGIETDAPEGHALATAVDAWLDEWLRAGSTSARRFLLWTGGRSNPLVLAFWDRVEAEFTAICCGQGSPHANA